MCTEVFDQRNVALDQILAERRSHRVFLPGTPTEDEVRRILHAGLLAPFAAAAAGPSSDYFRRFFVLPAGSAGLAAAMPLVMAEVVRMDGELKKGMEKDPVLREKAAAFARRLEQIQKAGRVPGIGTAPYFIVVAERKGFPPVQQLSLAHCLENMWLKATALGIGFQLVSATSQMSSNKDFCAILGLEPGEWELAGCAIGYVDDDLSPAIRPPVEDVTRWIP